MRNGGMWMFRLGGVYNTYEFGAANVMPGCPRNYGRSWMIRPECVSTLGTASSSTKGYVVQDTETGKVMVSTCVVFDETQKPFLGQHAGMSCSASVSLNEVVVVDCGDARGRRDGIVNEPNEGDDERGDVVDEPYERDDGGGMVDVGGDVRVGDEVDLVELASGERMPRYVDGEELPVLEAPGLEPGLPDMAPNFVPERRVPVRVPDSGPIRYRQANPKRFGTKSYERYERYKGARTVQDAIASGSKRDDLRWDAERGFCEFGDGIDGLSAGVGVQDEDGGMSVGVNGT